ncbi:MAG: bifunctional UDP-sugar hydrolase/5'-nucleotidase [Haloarculaceae archaeon]
MGPRLLHYSDVENALDDPERAGRLAGRLTARASEDALVVGTGDNTAPGVLSIATGGRQALPFFEAVDPDFETFGNHDFDHGLAATECVVRESPQQWLTANVARDGERFLPDATAPWALRTVAGARVGLVGVTCPDARYNPSAAALSFEDPFDAVAGTADALRSRGADYVVVLSHLGRDDERLAVTCDVDAILGGHRHDEVIERVEGTIVARPGANGHVVTEVDLGAGTATRHEVAGAPVNEDLAAELRALREEAGLDEVVARVADPIERSESRVHRGESRIGNLVADAYRWATGADVGLQNSGGIRAGDPLSGDVTVADLLAVVPFEEPVSVAEVSGTELREVVAQASGANLSFGDPDWWHGHFSGLAVTWDDDERAVETLSIDGDPVRDDAIYTVATSDFLFYTDGEFPALDASHRVETGSLQYEVLADYARNEGIDPSIEGRIVRR